jgi:hypothetical protein
MKTVYFLFFLLVTISGSAQKADVSLENIQIVQKGRYIIGYPKSWIIDTSKTLGMDIYLGSPRSDSLDQFSENMNVIFQSLEGQNYTLSRLGSESELQIKRMMNDVSILESKIDSSSSAPYYILKYNSRQGIFMLTIIQHFYLKDEVGYALTFTMQSENEKRYLPIAEKMFSTFRIF